jgi:nucleoside-diphosphate-sugar epimerase
MTCLVLGATGQTGRWLVRHLLERDEDVRVIVRSAERLPTDVRAHRRLTVIEGAVLDLSPAELAEAAAGCHAVASCLGHRLSVGGVFGPPWRLVRDAVRRTAEAVAAGEPEAPVRFVLMSTVGVRDPELNEPRTLVEHAIFGLLRVLLPPHADNERAADALRELGERHAGAIEWSAVRPEGLVDHDEVTAHRIDRALQQSPIFGPAKVSRINVAHFMAELMTDEELWSVWRGRMPVIADSAAADA